MILIVDDNIEWCLTMKKHINLVIPKEEVIECHNGFEVNEIYNRFKPELVLMDIELEDTNGIKVTSLLKKEFPESQVIIVSQYDDKILREESETAGAIGYVCKDSLSSINEYLLKFLL